MKSNLGLWDSILSICKAILDIQDLLLGLWESILSLWEQILWSMGVDILPMGVSFWSLRVDFRTFCERMLGVWEPNWGLLKSILALRGKFRLLSLNIGLLKLIVCPWESNFGVCGENSKYFGKRYKNYVIGKIKAYLYYNSFRFFGLFSLKQSKQ